VLNRPEGELTARGERQLAQDVVDVGLDGPLRDDELRGDLTIGEPPGDQGDDLAFAPGEPGELVVWWRRRCRANATI
jgi:hypothetical protein